jgi:flagellar motor switch protein FliN/FliY
MTATFGEHLPDLTLPVENLSPAGDALPRLPSAVLRIPVSVQVVIGTARLSLSQVADLKPGATVTLEEKLGTAARVLVNGREVAKGELFVLDSDQERLGLTITEVADGGQALP